MTDRRALVVAAVALAVLAVALPATGAITTERAGTANAGAVDEANVTSGASLSVALSVHESDLEGDVERRTLERALEGADDDEARAALLAERRLRAERRADALAERRDRLRAERRAGNLSESTHLVRATRLAAEARQLERQLAAVEAHGEPLPEDVRRAYGIDEPDLNRSRARVAGSTDAAFDDAFEAIVGERESVDVRAESPSTVETERAVLEAAARAEEMSTLLEALESGGLEGSLAECARENVSSSRRATDRALEALDRDDGGTAESALVDARVDLRDAHACLERANDVSVEGFEWYESYDVGDLESAEFDEDAFKGTDWNGTWDDEWEDREDFEYEGGNYSDDGSTDDGDFDARDSDDGSDGGSYGTDGWTWDDGWTRDE